jgi:hypothetical protein
MIREAVKAFRLARTAFPGRVSPVFVPPWNRIAPELVGSLRDLGYRAVSTFCGEPTPSPGLVRLETHLDPIDWRGTRGLRDVDELVRDLAHRLAAAREPIGLLTHHQAHDEATWRFIEWLAERLAASSAVRLMRAGDIVRTASRPVAELVG